MVLRPRRKLVSLCSPFWHSQKSVALLIRSEVVGSLSFHPAPNPTTQGNAASRSVITAAKECFLFQGEGVHFWGHLRLPASRSLLRLQEKRYLKKKKTVVTIPSRKMIGKHLFLSPPLSFCLWGWCYASHEYGKDINHRVGNPRGSANGSITSGAEEVRN